MRLPIHKSGAAGWLLVAGVVIAWDAAAPETMSSAFRRASATPARRAVVGLAWGLLTAHLFAALPKRADPLMLAVDAARSAVDPRRRGVPEWSTTAATAGTGACSTA